MGMPVNQVSPNPHHKEPSEAEGGSGPQRTERRVDVDHKAAGEAQKRPGEAQRTEIWCSGNLSRKKYKENDE